MKLYFKEERNMVAKLNNLFMPQPDFFELDVFQ